MKLFTKQLSSYSGYVNRLVCFKLCCFFLLSLGIGLPLQSQINIEFQWLYGKRKIVLDENPISLNTADSLHFETLKCYISKMVLFANNKMVFQESNSFHLVDASNPNSLTVKLNADSLMNYDSIQFYVGLDSITNVSGALGGDLDPTKGMYWAWHSGYINTKIEGSSKWCNNKNHAFQFHLGGYSYPTNSLQKIGFNGLKRKNQIIQIQMADWMNALKLNEVDHLMSPSKQAVLLSQKFANCFSMSQR